MSLRSKSAFLSFLAAARTACLMTVAGFLCCGALSGTAAGSTGSCNPERARELLSATVVNSLTTSLQDYPIAVSLDPSTFDFSEARQDGSDLAAWDAATGRRLAFWVESLDPAVGKGLVWVKIPSLAPQGTFEIWLTAGEIPACAVPGGDGYAVFPFFSDVRDVRSWRKDPSLSLRDDTDHGPLLVESRKVIESDGFYNSTPGIAEAANGDWVLSYLKGTTHVGSALVVLRRSQDHGESWSPEVVTFDTAKPDPTLARTPDGALIMSLVKLDQNGVAGAAYTRSQDNGLTWGPFEFLSDPVNLTSAFGPSQVKDGPNMFGLGYGPLPSSTTDAPSLWFSTDDGLTWSERSELSREGEPGLDETAIARIEPDTLLAVSRGGDNASTYRRRSHDLGVTWGPLTSLTSQIGAVQAPGLIRVGRALVLLGRQALGIPGVSPLVAFPRQLVAYVSYDDGRTFSYGTVLDTYTGLTIDGGYCSFLSLSDDRLFVVYYADSHGLRQPDIKSLILRVNEPRSREIHALHLVTQLASAQASHALGLDLTRYSLDFRFRSRPSPAGSQFSVRLSAPGADGPQDLVRWELPSTHATDPTSISGFFANQQFVPMLDSFTYGQRYRVRTLVDETQEVQTPEILDLFGQVLSAQVPQPFANATSVHPSILTIGNDSTLRSTDTLLDFVFLRPVSEIEPEVTLVRVR